MDTLPDTETHTGLAGLMDVSAGEIELAEAPALPASTTLARPRRAFGRRFWREVVCGAVAVVLLHLFVIQVSVVRGMSMAPSLRDGDRLVVDRLSYSMVDVSRFDVVVLRYPKNPRVDFVKRIVGLPGDRVELANGLLTVNGRPVPENFAHVADVHAIGTWVVDEDSYFVLGDNRPISCDSREFGLVARDLLKGRVRACFWPLDRFTLF